MALPAAQASVNAAIPVGGMLMIASSGGEWTAVVGDGYQVQSTVNWDNSIEETSTHNNSAYYSFDVVDSETFEMSKNIALLKPAFSSSIQTYEYLASFAVDGNQGTRWSSEWNDPQSLAIDLEDVYIIKAINVFWEAAYADRYKVELSEDKINWVTYVEVNKGSGGKDEFTTEASEGYRYVRITGLHRATSYGYSIYEIEVFGSKMNIDTTIEYIDYTQQNLYPNPVKDTLYIKHK